ncbi:MAG TPA: heparinase II/III family protein [Luteolibacter sp.]|nr:heparinase II/III family protein [Luteolibacter sp.]
MIRCRLLLLPLLLSLPLQAQFAAIEHPRLLMREADEAAVRQRIEKDPLAAKLQSAVLAEADRILTHPTCRYDIPDGRRLLAQSRLAVQQVLFTCWAWRFTGKAEYRDRAIEELKAACALKDWNTSHFLDTAEMATAVAIGYDWLYADLNAGQRAMCEKAIRDKALKPAKAVYDSKGWWTKASNNWSQVCGGGIGLAAIAIEGKDEGLSGDLIPRSIKLVERCDHFYEPDGLYPEGPGYWHYGTSYHVLLLAACKTLSHPMAMPAKLSQSAESMMHLHGPTSLPFNFADGHAGRQTMTPPQSWIATHGGSAMLPGYVRAQLEAADRSGNDKGMRQGYAPLHLLWLPPAGKPSGKVSLHAVFKGEQSAAMFRTNWQPDAAWLAIKGGSSQGGHSQMDVGTFCYDAHGERWFHDLGSDNYNMPGYFGSKRFTYFRNQNRSHNTLEINGALQVALAAPCQPTESSLSGNPATVTYDLSAAYASSAKSVKRSVAFDATNGRAVIADVIEQAKGEIAWRAYTDAKATIEGKKVILSKKDQSIQLERLSDQGVWSIEPATPPQSIENPNKGFQAIVLRVPQKQSVRIEVAIEP